MHMATGEATTATTSRGDIWVAVGVVFCLGLGASMTYWLTKPAASARTAVAPNPAVQPPKPDATAQVPSPNGSATATVPTAPAKADGDYATVGFDTLGSYYYAIPDLEESNGGIAPPAPKDQIPAPIKALNGKKVAVKGFMMPLTAEKGA